MRRTYNILHKCKRFLIRTVIGLFVWTISSENAVWLKVPGDHYIQNRQCDQIRLFIVTFYWGQNQKVLATILKYSFRALKACSDFQKCLVTKSFWKEWLLFSTRIDKYFLQYKMYKNIIKVLFNSSLSQYLPFDETKRNWPTNSHSIIVHTCICEYARMFSLPCAFLSSW